MKAFFNKWNFQSVRELGPYLAMVLLVPGGSVVALVMWLFQHRHKECMK